MLLAILAALGACGARTDLGGARQMDASIDSGVEADACAALLLDGGCAAQSCANGTCSSTLTSGPVHDLAIDSTSLYWTTEGAVMTAALCGANGHSLATCVQPTLLALDAVNVYFVEGAAHEQQITSSLSRVPKAGGNVVKLASFQNEQALALVHAGDGLYLSLRTYTTTTGRIVRVPTAGGAPTTLFSGAVDTGLAVDSDYVFWNRSGYLMRADHDGNGTMQLADTFLPIVSDRGASAISVDAKYVYWSDGCGAVGRVARDGSDTPGLVGSVSQTKGVTCTGGDPSRPLFVDDVYAYMAFAGNSAVTAGVFRMPKSGGEVLQLEVDSATPGTVTVDSSALYWVDATSTRSLTPK